MTATGPRPKNRHDPRPAFRRDPGVAVLQAKFGARLAELREAALLTQEEAAEKLGVSSRHLQRVEAGKTNLTVLLLHRFGQIYGFDVEMLFSAPSP